MRYNIFNQIHKALRVMLFEVAVKLQQTNFENSQEAGISLKNLETLLDTFDKHAGHEDAHILPAIAKYDPALVDAFEKEHVEDHALAEKLRTLLEIFENQPSSTSKLVTGTAILRSFIDFMCFNLAHMNREETVLNETLHNYYSDTELRHLNHQIVASIPPAEMEQTAAWMMKGLNNTEITAWLKGVQANAPEYVFNMLFSISEKELSPMRFRQILEDLTEGAMVA